LKIGDQVEIEAPNGTFIFPETEANSIVLVGAGVGVTPMMSITRYLTDTGWPGNIHLVLGFTAPRDFIFRGELDDLKARNRNLSLTVTMSRPGDEPWSGPHRAR
jgi:ferredoxin-NADP reductase